MKNRILISAIMSFMVLTAFADEYTDPQTNVVYTYEPGQSTASVKAGHEESDGSMCIDFCPGSPDAAGDVMILDKFTIGTNEYVVTSIGECAFWSNHNIKSVIIPESVTNIGMAAFEDCQGLTSVQLPEGLTRIPKNLFLDCRKLESVAIPSSVRAIDEQAFENCFSLASLTLPTGLNYIGRDAFRGTPWYSTQYNEAPNGLFYIGPLLVGYKGDAPTGELVIKEGTTCIGTEAFLNCKGLTSVTIPESLTHVDYQAFYNCVGLTAVHITNLAAWCKIEFQWDYISGSSNPLFNAHHLYLNGEEVTDLIIPDGVTSIGRYAFDNCTGLTSVTIPDGVTRISSNAFRNCSNFTSVTIPPSVAIIESMSFLWCKNLTAVHISDLAAWCGISFQTASDFFNYGARLYLNGEEVSDLVIPDGVASIGSRSFMKCSQLTSVTIPKSLTILNSYAFADCIGLKDVYCYAENVPQTGEEVFGYTPIASATLHVPAGSLEKYKTTSPWSGFGNIVAMPIEINEENFPDENFRSWVLAKDFGKDGVLTEEEIAGVTKIKLTSKTITSLKGIEYFTELTFLLVELAQITEIDVSRLTKLTYLDCSLMQISKIDVSKNTALTELYCGGNLLTSLDVSNNTALTTLSCNSNKLTSLDVSNNTELENLYCKDNQLTELDVSKNKELKRLACSNNQLTKLELKNLAKLESLICIQNRLERIIVSDCPELEDIICHNNQIRGEAVDEFIAGLPTVPHGWGHLCIIDPENEQNVMTKSQVAAARAKGWHPRYKYGAFGTPGYTDYEGIDDPTGIGDAPRLNDKGQMINEKLYDLQGRRLSGKPARGIYIENGKKIAIK